MNITVFSCSKISNNSNIYGCPLTIHRIFASVLRVFLKFIIKLFMYRILRVHRTFFKHFRCIHFFIKLIIHLIHCSETPFPDFFKLIIRFWIVSPNCVLSEMANSIQDVFFAFGAELLLGVFSRQHKGVIFLLVLNNWLIAKEIGEFQIYMAFLFYIQLCGKLINLLLVFTSY